MSYTEYLLSALAECAALRELTLRYRRIDTISPRTRTHNTDAGADMDPTHAQNILEALCAHLAGAPNPMLWIDNTGDVWPELRTLLSDFNPARIVVNTDRDIAFAGGMHVGEMKVLKEERLM